MANTQNSNLKNLIITGEITATSKKSSDKFKADTKTAYLKVDKENATKLTEFGLQEYSSQDNKETFFIVRLVRNLKMYQSTNEDDKTPIDLSDLSELTTPNFMTTKPVKMNIIEGKSEEFGTKFFRLQAILGQSDDIQLVESENPFA